MEVTAFLPGFPHEALRLRLWGLFQSAEAEARRFVLPGDWMEIASVSASERNSWSGDRIMLSPRADDLGAIFHEVFRPAFFRSRFRDGEADGKWAGAFCDAFRYFMERQLGLSGESPWFARMDGLVRAASGAEGPTIEAALARPGCPDPERMRTCEYPASLIIARAGRDYRLFRAIWFDLQEQRMQANQPLLDWKFGYTVP
jgi:hypothetical protein